MLSHPNRLLAVAATLVVPLALVAGCTDSPEPSPSPSTTVAATTPPAASPSATPSSGLDAADEAAILAAFDEYKAAYLTAYSTPDAANSLWADFGDEELVATQVGQVKDYIDQGIVFTGSPSYSGTVVTDGDGDTAVVRTCVDESAWIGEVDGEPLPPRPDDVYPFTLSASKASGEWRLGLGPKLPEGETC